MNNFQRMLELVDEVFSTRNDPDQLQVDQDVIARLEKLHPATLSEHNVDGPVVWILIIPTTTELMEKFLAGKISENDLFNETKEGMNFDCIYLCSASVLPEYRKKGLAKKLTVDAIRAIQKDFPIQTLFVWPFTKEGDALAEKIAKEVGLVLRKKKDSM
jgi:hypothetical protein